MQLDGPEASDQATQNQWDSKVPSLRKPYTEACAFTAMACTAVATCDHIARVQAVSLFWLNLSPAAQQGASGKQTWPDLA